MALRWRSDGTLLCAARHPEESDDTYIDDRLHYELSINQRALMADPQEGVEGSEFYGRWYWVHDEDQQFLMARPQAEGPQW